MFDNDNILRLDSNVCEFHGHFISLRRRYPNEARWIAGLQRLQVERDVSEDGDLLFQISKCRVRRETNLVSFPLEANENLHSKKAGKCRGQKKDKIKTIDKNEGKRGLLPGKRAGERTSS